MYNVIITRKTKYVKHKNILLHLKMVSSEDYNYDTSLLRNSKNVCGMYLWMLEGKRGGGEKINTYLPW